jgi:hypothetical protein
MDCRAIHSCDPRRRQRGGALASSISSVGGAVVLNCNAYCEIESLHRMNFIVPDELGYLPFAQSGGQLLFYLVSRLYERASIVVTTNLPSVNGAARSATHIIRGRAGISLVRAPVSAHRSIDWQ